MCRALFSGFSVRRVCDEPAAFLPTPRGSVSVPYSRVCDEDEQQHMAPPCEDDHFIQRNVWCFCLRRDTSSASWLFPASRKYQRWDSFTAAHKHCTSDVRPSSATHLIF